MPNGDDNFIKELPGLNLFFSKIAPTIEAVAKEHNLEISKYYHEFPSWDLCFSHPKGGTGKIEIAKEENVEDRVSIYGCWWVDDYDKFSRYSKNIDKRVVSTEPYPLRQSLEEILFEIMFWNPGDWSEIHSGYKKIWGKYTKEDFERVWPKYPHPIFTK